MNTRRFPFALSVLSLALFHSPLYAADQAETVLDTVKVESNFRDTELQQSTTSVTVVDEDHIEQRAARGLDDLIGIMPNVNAASGASNANYFQIRGIGERGQFSTPLNPSVGVLVDDFDFSRMGAAATMFDVKQVEVLRGPQGTRFGSSAMAGVIQVTTNEATDEPAARIETTVGSRNTAAAGVMLNGPIAGDSLVGRLAVYKHTSDGYMQNTHLDKNNTQNEDELTARANLKWYATDNLEFDLKVLKLNLDNGYDAFNFDNDYKTISDEPGHDRLKGDAVAFKTIYNMPKSELQATVTHSDTTSEYGYDDDWTYVGFDPNGYSAFDNYQRHRRNSSLDLRLTSNESGRLFNNKTDWVVGTYFLSQEEELKRTYPYIANGKSTSDYNTLNASLYGQLDHHVSSRLTLTAGLRAERFEADYKDSSGFKRKTDEMLYGGKLGASYQLTQEHLGFVTLSKGYKAGGVNANQSLPKNKIPFDTETLWSLETGLNSSMLEGRLNTRLNVFYALRKDMQVRSSTQKDGSPDFVIYQDNAAEGDNYGLEGQADWLIIPEFRMISSLGLLHTSFTDYTYVDPNDATKKINLNGRDQAHAPSYQYSLGGEVYVTPNWTLAANLEGKDAFYFSDSHNQKSKAYTLANANVQYKNKHWTVIVWGRNLGDTKYATRGYYFGIDPRTGYADGLYTQQGEPRTFGATVAYDF